jgi:hypothetical protein
VMYKGSAVGVFELTRDAKPHPAMNHVTNLVDAHMQTRDSEHAADITRIEPCSDVQRWNKRRSNRSVSSIEPGVLLCKLLYCFVLTDAVSFVGRWTHRTQIAQSCASLCT